MHVTFHQDMTLRLLASQVIQEDEELSLFQKRKISAQPMHTNSISIPDLANQKKIARVSSFSSHTIALTDQLKLVYHQIQPKAGYSIEGISGK